jgi:hypothetical protein
MLAVALPIAGVVADARPAGACSCVGLSDADALEHADAAFVGKVTDYSSAGRPGSASDRALWTFKVRDVYKGTVTRTQQVVSYSSGASCGLEIQERGVFLVFATTNRTLPTGPAPKPGQLYATLCGGTRAASEGLLEPDLAKPHPPRKS